MDSFWLCVAVCIYLFIKIRHDGDALVTRTKKEIVGYNVKVADLLKSAFTLDNNRTLPIVPCIGNVTRNRSVRSIVLTLCLTFR